MDKKIIFGGVLGLMFLGVLVWFLFFRKDPTTGATIVSLPGSGDKDKKDKDKPAGASAGTTVNNIYQTSNGANAAVSDGFPVKMGHPNKAVIKQLQQTLVKLGKLKAGQDDGTWGNGTESALKSAGFPTQYNTQAELAKVINYDVSGQTKEIGEIKISEKYKGMYKIGATQANMRKTPFGGSSIVKIYKNGDRLKGTGEYYVNGTITWIRVSPPGSFTYGWMYSSALDEV